METKNFEKETMSMEEMKNVATEVKADDNMEKAMAVKTLIDGASETEEQKFYDSLPSNNGQMEVKDEDLGEPEFGTASVDIDPVTGQYRQIAEQTGLTEDMVKMLEITPEDLVNIPESIYDIEVDKDILIKNIEANGIKDDELVEPILDIVLEYRKTPEDKRDQINWYSKLPEKLKLVIDKEALKMNNATMFAKKLFAAQFIEDVLTDSGMDQITIDMEKSFAKAFDTSGIMRYMLQEEKTAFEKSIEAMIKKVESVTDSPEDAKQKQLEILHGIENSFKEAYTLEGFINAIKHGKVRVKKFHIEKYKRFVREFYSKYEGDTPFQIQDPTRIAPILKRRYMEFTPEQCVAYVIGFFQYTKNMRANDVVDHTYMSYFISNILQLDLVGDTVEERDFLNILSNNVRTALYAINNIPMPEVKDEDVHMPPKKECEESVSEQKEESDE